MTDDRQQITGAILAGGRGSRLGGRDKGLADLNGRPLIEHVLERLYPQVSDIVIAANRNFPRYREYGFPVLPDRQNEYRGPLAGIESALSHAVTPYVLIVPCDGPWLAHNLVAHLHRVVTEAGAKIAVAESGDRLQPLFALLGTSLLPDLQNFLDEGGRAVHGWYSHHTIAHADFSHCPQAFVNLNTPDDFASEVKPCATA